MGERSSICCVGARSTRREQPTHQKLGRATSFPLCVAHFMARSVPRIPLLGTRVNRGGRAPVCDPCHNAPTTPTRLFSPGVAGERRRKIVARILTLDPERARGLRKALVWMAKRQYGGAVPGLLNILAQDLNIGLPVNWIYNHLHMRKSSPLSRLQREMLATVVNGLIGGAP
jgi:hypothetical protein